MDVTSLLNGPSVAVDQPKEGDHWPIPTRSRTPWDAGGYSLPVNSHHKPQGSVTATYTVTSVNQASQHIEAQQSPEPVSSSHRLSDSRSSLSSFASASTSNNHSRYSSTSTISGFHPSSSIIESRKSLEEDQANQLYSGPLSNTEKISNVSSPKGSLSTLAFAAGYRLQLQIPSDSSRDLTMPSTMHTRSMSEIDSPSQDDTEQSRPGSPSDAVLFKRPSVSGYPRSPDAENDPTQDRRGSSQVGPTSSTPRSASTTASTSTLRHKRAISAPDFAAAAGTDGRQSRKLPSMGPVPEPTPPSSHHPDRLSPEASWNAPDSAPDTPPEAECEPAQNGIVCMYIANCNTESQPRKAISHIFGRNKMCTRLIPPSVWVHFCRKHYQRSRYRNQKEYAKLQCNLIKEQIWRLDHWSDMNRQKGEGGIVKDWGLAVRKREQKRLDDLAELEETKPSGDRRDSEDIEDEERPEPVPPTAVPKWLQHMTGRGFNSEYIKTIFDRLHAEIEEDVLSAFPDIEILPNIILDAEEPKSPQGYTKRKPVGTAHKRSQSLGGAALRNDIPQPRRMSQPIKWNASAMYGGPGDSPQQKRKRSMEDLDEEDRFTRSPSSQRQRLASIPSEMPMRHPSHIPHRSAFEHIQEQYQEEHPHGYEHRGGSYESQSHHAPPRQHYRASSVSTRQIPLPAPTPQRRASQSTASQLDNRFGTPVGAPHHMYSHQEPRRSAHHRSQSDMGAVHYSHGNYSFTSAQHFPPPPPQHILPSQGRPGQLQRAPSNPDMTPRATHSHPYVHSPYPGAQNQPPQGHYHGPPPPQQFHGHNRHLSTPAIPGHYSHSPGPQQQPQMQQPQRHYPHPPLHGHSHDHDIHYPANRSEEQHPGRGYRTEEPQQARNVYAARR